MSTSYASINIKPQGGGGGQATHGKLTECAFPWVGILTFKRWRHISINCNKGGKLTFSRCLGVGNLTLASIKMSNSPGSAHPPTLGLNIDRCITSLILACEVWFKAPPWTLDFRAGVVTPTFLLPLVDVDFFPFAPALDILHCSYKLKQLCLTDQNMLKIYGKNIVARRVLVVRCFGSVMFCEGLGLGT